MTGSAADSLLARATALLARREHSEHELSLKLTQKGHPLGEIRAVLADLKVHGLLSDERFTESLVNSRRERGYGPLRISQDLRSKGVAQELIERWVDVNDPQWLDVLRMTWTKKFGGDAPESYKEWARQARFLQSRGFTSEQIRKIVDLDD